ncbi:HAD-IIB family hydrolase [Fundidesulfovibrio putealis]|uniref:HAD-IIB family hydrolase n=1 Tax=Fundidesulfovibrio putealis TaxID=270496 RepID=UPI00146FA2F5|nr:HAD family hydrolase [Fundidesulfovibrio putealis]
MKIPKELPSWDRLTPEDARPFGRIRLIAADLDGTLVQQGASDIFNVIAKLRSSLAHSRYDVGVTIATGRAFSGVANLVSKIGIPRGMPMVLYNGSVVLRCGTTKIIQHKSIDRRVVREVLGVLGQTQVTVLVYYFLSPSDLFISPFDFQEKVCGWTKCSQFKNEFNGLPVDWRKDLNDLPNLNASAILIHSECLDVLKAARDSLVSFKEISITFSGGKHIEIRPHGSNKASALVSVAKVLGLSRDEVLALGDNDNDAEMLEWAGIGVCVGHSSDEAVSHSDYKCKYNVEKGAIEVLRVVRQARRYFREDNTCSRRENLS